ncbi:hypothetical protein MASRES_GEN12904_13165 [Acinetobacter baumannii]
MPETISKALPACSACKTQNKTKEITNILEATVTVGLSPLKTPDVARMTPPWIAHRQLIVLAVSGSPTD